MRIIRRRCPRFSQPQKVALVKFMKDHPKLSSGQIDVHFRQEDAKAMWNNLTKHLNSIPGARKTSVQWRKAWRDICLSEYKREQIKKRKHNYAKGLDLKELSIKIEPISDHGISLDIQDSEASSCDQNQYSSSSRSSPKEFPFADVRSSENEPNIFDESIRQKDEKDVSPIVELARELMKNFKSQAEAEAEYRETHLQLIRQQNVALNSIAKSLERLKK